MEARIAIIGSGISGLSAGYQLRKAGFDPVIFERASFVGGRMSSEFVDGFIIDKAAYSIMGSYSGLHQCLRELNMGDSLVPTDATSSTFAGGEEYRLRIGSIVDFLKFGLLPPRSKIGVVKLFLYAKSLGKTLDLANPSPKTFALERESVTDYLLRLYDVNILEYLAYPIFCESFLGTPENNAAPVFLSAMKRLAGFEVFSPEQGMGMLPDRLKKQLDVRLQTPVLQVGLGGGAGPYELQVGGQSPESLIFDSVIIAVPATQVPAMVPELPADLAKHFQDVCYAPSVVVALAVDKPYPHASMINNLSRKDFGTVGSLVFDHHKGPGRVPSGKGLVTAILNEPASRASMHLPDDDVVNSVLKDVDSVFPGLSDQLLFTRIYRWEHGAVQFPPGTLRKQHSAKQALEAQFDNLYFASDGFSMSGLEDSFGTGIRAANHVANQFGRDVEASLGFG